MSCKKERQCGTIAKYVKDGCRCEACKAEYSDYRKTRAPKAKEKARGKQAKQQPPAFEIKADPAEFEHYWQDLQSEWNRIDKMYSDYRAEYPERFDFD